LNTILNRENIGKTSDELVARWNEEDIDAPLPSSNRSCASTPRPLT
jgi:hypothetical protein